MWKNFVFFKCQPINYVELNFPWKCRTARIECKKWSLEKDKNVVFIQTILLYFFAILSKDASYKKLYCFVLINSACFLNCFNRLFSLYYGRCFAKFIQSHIRNILTMFLLLQYIQWYTEMVLIFRAGACLQFLNVESRFHISNIKRTLEYITFIFCSYHITLQCIFNSWRRFYPQNVNELNIKRRKYNFFYQNISKMFWEINTDQLKKLKWYATWVQHAGIFYHSHWLYCIKENMKILHCIVSILQNHFQKILIQVLLQFYHRAYNFDYEKLFTFWFFKF